MSMDLLEAAVFVPKVAPLTIWTELFTVKLAAVLRLVFIVVAELLLAKVELVVTQLLSTVRILALGAVAAESGLGPVLAHLPFVHGALDEALTDFVAPLMIVLEVEGATVVLMSDMLGHLDR